MNLGVACFLGCYSPEETQATILSPTPAGYENPHSAYLLGLQATLEQEARHTPKVSNRRSRKVQVAA